MKLHGVVELHVRGERIYRDPTFWDKLRKLFGGDPDLFTGKKKAALEASALVDGTREALRRLGASNAISLVIDDQVLFRDVHGKPDDLGDLFLAFHDHAPVFGAGFQLLRLAVEHEEAGLHAVLEVVAQSEHPEAEPAARIVISGRVRDFEPRAGEAAEAYRARVEPLLKLPSLYETHRRQFESFVVRVADAMRAAMPEARVQVAPSEAQVERPPARATATTPGRPSRQPPPTDRRYDPYVAYYPNPYGMLFTFLMWDAIFSFAAPPHLVVVNQHGDALGAPADLGHDVPAHEVSDTGDGAFHDFDGDGVADNVDVGDGGGFDGGGFDGGGFDGGDFGGGDF